MLCVWACQNVTNVELLARNWRSEHIWPRSIQSSKGSVFTIIVSLAFDEPHVCWWTSWIFDRVSSHEIYPQRDSTWTLPLKKVELWWLGRCLLIHKYVFFNLMMFICYVAWVVPVNIPFLLPQVIQVSSHQFGKRVLDVQLRKQMALSREITYPTKREKEITYFLWTLAQNITCQNPCILRSI